MISQEFKKSNRHPSNKEKFSIGTYITKVISIVPNYACIADFNSFTPWIFDWVSRFDIGKGVSKIIGESPDIREHRHFLRFKILRRSNLVKDFSD